jgi:hypothetical protein
MRFPDFSVPKRTFLIFVNQIAIGSHIWVKKQYGSNRMTEMKINQNKILLNEDFATIIYVKQLKQQI